MAISRTNGLIRLMPRPRGRGRGYHRALLVGSILMAGAAVLALRIGDTRQAVPLVMVNAELRRVGYPDK